jgi:hypothetical protein
VGKEIAMFTAKIQKVDRRGNYETLTASTLEQFDESVAEEAYATVDELNKLDETSPFRVGLHLKDEGVPSGWDSKELPFSIQIWKPTIETSTAARAKFAALKAEYSRLY